jgi:hypothetical protein
LELRGLERDVLNSVVEDFEKIEEFLSEPENLKNCRGYCPVFLQCQEGIRSYKAPLHLQKQAYGISKSFG